MSDTITVEELREFLDGLDGDIDVYVTRGGPVESATEVTFSLDKCWGEHITISGQ